MRPLAYLFVFLSLILSSAMFAPAFFGTPIALLVAAASLLPIVPSLGAADCSATCGTMLP